MRHRIRQTVHRVRPHAVKASVWSWRRIKGVIRRHRIFLSICVVVLIFSRLTNPFVSGNIVREPFGSHVDDSGSLVLSSESDILLRSNRAYKNLALLKSGVHIITNAYSGSEKTKSSTIEGIIDEIHALRFDPKYPYLISGDHFSVLYPRSLGIFYATLLDPRTARSDSDWLHRQQIYLQTTAYALDSFTTASSLSTTIVPISRRAVTSINIYSYPADTLYSLLYALRVMQDETLLTALYPTTIQTQTKLSTVQAGRKLQADYTESLQRHLREYIATVYDQKTGLIRTDIALSGTKDITRQYSGFYANVIFWKTISYAQDLGLISRDTQYLSDLRARILETFWDDSAGIFLEDLSQESREKKHYSSDWLIALQTGFLDLSNSTEVEKVERIVSYIRTHRIDRPFGLKYSQLDRRSQMYLWPGVAAPAYGGSAIWSHWGIEYIKLLTRLYQETGKAEYRDEAYYQLERYAENIEKYRGYPEVYDSTGNIFSTLFYTSVRRTGWVVNFEQARLLVEDASATKSL